MDNAIKNVFKNQIHDVVQGNSNHNRRDVKVRSVSLKTQEPVSWTSNGVKNIFSRAASEPLFQWLSSSGVCSAGYSCQHTSFLVLLLASVFDQARLADSRLDLCCYNHLTD
jgi:hypothetical protein